MAAFEPFTAFGEAYEKAASTIVNSSISHLVSVLSPVIVIGITLYIMITGYMVVAGRIQDPISDILIKLTKWVIISWIALNASTITNYLISGVNGLL
ncbi:type IV secretion system protein [Kingella kingae]|uniref:type IV secretion system protein n=1 Tax=Kingella kingae TaxID=504 RepID=UPI00254BA185|nr:type IV secretion system protein [Kingella kingae]MDK4650696.1 type IV secretion system protein [Kingella kingae]